jgi:hypothetical protein
MASKPGAPAPGVGGVSSDFEFQEDERLSTNPNLTRMPTTQQEWNGFIRELNKWTKNITDGFVPTVTGFSSDPSDMHCWFQRYGQLVFLRFPDNTTGTSDSTLFTISNLPAIITPKVDLSVIVEGVLVDNSGNLVRGASSAYIKADGTIHFNAAFGTDNGWTNSGSKGFGLTGSSIAYVTYFLMHPSKL